MIKEVVILLILFFVLSLVWEVAHSVLYDWNKKPLENSLKFKSLRLSKSVLGDVMILTVMFLIVSGIVRSLTWINSPGVLEYSLIIVMGLAVAVFIEMRNLGVAWNYNSLMPTVFGIGLSPLVQLALTFLISMWIVKAVG
jgi:hypothetical protein